MDNNIKNTALYQNIKYTISEAIKFNSDNLLDNIMNILEPFIKGQLNHNDEFNKLYAQAMLSSKIIIPIWTELDDTMVDSIISDTLQKSDLDDDQINWLKNLKSNFHIIQNEILNNK